mgnify:CR=1 FL=1
MLSPLIAHIITEKNKSWKDAAKFGALVFGAVFLINLIIKPQSWVIATIIYGIITFLIAKHMKLKDPLTTTVITVVIGLIIAAIITALAIAFLISFIGMI